ncbi:MAG: sugar ABC transporter permease [Lachnospiraceae bacterium]|nr:sugar ABC transporter permease [Lachnospiraceae bacterium]
MEKVVRRYWPLFVVPTLAAFIIGFIVPFGQGLYLSFCKFTTISNAEWVGWDNYIRVFTDDPNPLVDSLWFTVAFAVVSIILINLIGFLFALVLTRGLRGTNIFRTIFFMPNLIGGVVLGYIWQILINCVLSLVEQPLLALNSTAGYWGLIILMCWQQVGYMMIIYIAGLQGIPDSISEAAKIDGASSWQTLIKIKLPMIMPSITICVFLTLTNSFKLFDQNMALTNGEPMNSTTMLALNIYKTFYDRVGPSWKGLGQAKAVIFCILVVLVSFGQLRATRSKEVQQ